MTKCYLANTNVIIFWASKMALKKVHVRVIIDLDNFALDYFVKFRHGSLQTFQQGLQ